MKKYILLIPVLILSGCATLTEDAMTPISISFSDGSNGKAHLQNKRGAWETKIPNTVYVRKSDDGLKYDAETKDGRKVSGIIPSSMGGKIIASAVFIDFGITDAITDKHRQYPVSFVIPIEQVDGEKGNGKSEKNVSQSAEERLAEIDRLLKAGLITEEESAEKRKEILDNI